MENRLIVADSGWAKSIPKWILEEVESERMINGMIKVVGKKKIEEWETVGDAEVVAYLFTHSLKAPMSTEFTNIYLYLSQKLMKRRKLEIPEDIKKEELSEYEESELIILKQSIARVRGKVNHPIFEILNELKKGKKISKEGESNG